MKKSIPISDNARTHTRGHVRTLLTYLTVPVTHYTTAGWTLSTCTCAW